MKWSRVLLARMIVLLAAATGMGAWASAHGGYPNPVYYQERLWTATGVGANAPEDIREWIDPQANRILEEDRQGTFHEKRLLRDGRMFFFGTGRGYLPEGYAMANWATNALYMQQFRGGFAGDGRRLLKLAVGPVVHVRFEGRAALRFSMRIVPNTAISAPTTVWLDARMLEQLEARSIVGQGRGTSTFQYVRERSYTPNTLPAGFFDPPSARKNLWDRATGWAQDRLAGR